MKIVNWLREAKENVAADLTFIREEGFAYTAGYYLGFSVWAAGEAWERFWKGADDGEGREPKGPRRE